MSVHALKQVIAAADQVISAGDYDAVLDFYSDDAALVVKPGRTVTGKAQIRKAFDAIADYFNHDLSVSQGAMTVIEAGDTALVIMESVLTTGTKRQAPQSLVRRATYVFRQQADGRWLCVIDNSYGTDLLNPE